MGSKGGTPKTRVVDYFMSIHLGVCLSADSIEAVFINDKEAWIGSSSALEPLAVNKPDLFGGVKKEGGPVGTIYHFPGKADQVIPAEVASRFNLTPATMPAYRGLTTLFFCGSTGWQAPSNAAGGSGIANGLINDVIGAAYQGGQGGFKWSSNSPIIAQKLAVRVRRASVTPLNAAHKVIEKNGRKNSNPAHMIYECLTNTEWGMGSPAGSIDNASFNAAAETLFTENFGLTMIWSRQTEIESFIGEINDHIQGVIFLHPRSGLWTLKLIRDDYNINTLRTINPDNANLSNFDRRMWGEVTNEVTVSWTNPENEQTETVTAQDLAANFIQGSPIPSARDFYGVRDAETAMMVAQREVRLSSAALASANAVLDRRAWDVTPGEVVILTWPEYNLNGVVMRVGTVDYGNPGDKKVSISLIEDIFSLEKPPINIPPSTQWTAPGSLPAPMAAQEIITIPAYFAMSGDFQRAAIDLIYPEVLAGIFGYQNDPDTISFELLAEGVGSTGAAGFYPAGTKTVVERTILAVAMPQAVTGRIPDITVINKRRGPEVGGFVWLGAGSDANMEIAQVTGFDEATQEWVLARAVLDTTPRAWPVGTPVWFVNPGTRVADDRTVRSAGEAVDYKLLSRTSRGVLAVADAPIITEVLTARPHLPLRPGNVKINGTAFGNVAAPGPLVITWATRNRLLEDGQVIRWDAAQVPPEYAQGTIITVIAGGATVYEQKLWLAQTVTLQSAWFDRWPDARIYVGSRREGLDSIQAHSIGVTGLANNPAAPLPPVPADPGPAPSFGLAPAVGAWTALGYAFEKTDAGVVTASVPAILVSGARDRPDAVGLIVRYALVAGNDWFVLPTVSLDDNPAQSATTAVKPTTDYKVEAAYVDTNGLLSNWRSLGVVTTGALTMGGVGDLSYARIKAAVDFLETIGGEGAALSNLIRDLEASIDLTAEGVLGDILRDVDDKERFEKLLRLPDGQLIGNVYAKERIEWTRDNETFNMNFELLGSISTVNGQRAFVFNSATTYITPTQSIARFREDILAEYATNFGSYTRQVELISNASGNATRSLQALGSANALFSAFTIDLSRTLVTGGQSLSEHIQSVAARSVDGSGFVATAVSQSKTYVDTQSAFALTMQELSVSTPSGFITRITEQQRVDSNGVAIVGLRLQSGTYVTGFVMTNSGESGDIVWLQDKFIIASPTGNKQPFVFDTATGTLKLRGVEAEEISVGTVRADKIISNSLAETFRNAITGNSVLPAPGGGTVEVGQLTVDASGGLFDINVFINTKGSSGGSIGVHFTLVAYAADGVTVVGQIGPTFGNYVLSPQNYNSTTFFVTWRPPGGRYILKVLGQKDAGGGTMTVDYVYIAARDNKTQA